jgi:hypothetical protein
MGSLPSRLWDHLAVCLCMSSNLFKERTLLVLPWTSTLVHNFQVLCSIAWVLLPPHKFAWRSCSCGWSQKYPDNEVFYGMSSNPRFMEIHKLFLHALYCCLQFIEGQSDWQVLTKASSTITGLKRRNQKTKRKLAQGNSYYSNSSTFSSTSSSLSPSNLWRYH